jgi:hypothetical protein
MPSECIHGLEFGCTICSGMDKDDPPEEIIAHFHAKYEGQCSGCNLPIHLGEHCVKLSSERVVHYDAHQVRLLELTNAI